MSILGAFKDADPGYTVNIYNDFNIYTIPGLQYGHSKGRCYSWYHAILEWRIYVLYRVLCILYTNNVNDFSKHVSWEIGHVVQSI